MNYRQRKYNEGQSARNDIYGFLVKYFENNKDRMSLTDKIIESMLLLADTVESQMEEVK